MEITDIILYWGFALRNLFKRKEKVIDRFSIIVWFIPFFLLDGLYIFVSLIIMFVYGLFKMLYLFLLLLFSFFIWIFYPEIFNYIERELEIIDKELLYIIVGILIMVFIFGLSWIISLGMS